MDEVVMVPFWHQEWALVNVILVWADDFRVWSKTHCTVGHILTGCVSPLDPIVVLSVTSKHWTIFLFSGYTCMQISDATFYLNN